MQRRLNEAHCWTLFNQLFPQGLGDPSLLDELAPTGWDRSPLLRVFHPTLEQLYEESVRIHANLQSFFAPGGGPRDDPAPTLEEVRRSRRDEPVRPREECADLLGRCLWDIFSDNHEVFTAEGTLVDLGSFRASAGFMRASATGGGDRKARRRAPGITWTSPWELSGWRAAPI